MSETVRSLTQPTCAIPLFETGGQSHFCFIAAVTTFRVCEPVTGKRGLDPALTLSPRGAIVPFEPT